MSRGTVGEPLRPGVLQLAEAFSEKLAGWQARSTRALREEVWARRLRPFWRITPSAYRRLSRVLQGRGENFLSIEVANEGLAWFPEDPELLHLLGLAYARTGATDPAEEFARRLLETLAEGTIDEPPDGPRAVHWEVEARTLQARLDKDRAAAATTERERTTHLRASLEHYEAAYRRGERGSVEDGKYYPAINAAAVAAFLEDRERVTRYATLARASCQRALSQGSGDPYWPAATLAECALLLGKSDQAVLEAYRRATALAPGDWAKQNATRRQARTTLRAQRRPSEWLDGCFTLPRVVLFAGHLTDAPGRDTPRFPEAVVPRVAERIAAWLERGAPERAVPLIGFASAARGGDLLFLEAMQARGDEFHVVLPCGVDAFRACSVEPAGEPNGWGERFDHILEAATSVWTLPAESGEPTAETFAYGNQVLHGLALQKAREFELDDAHLLTLAVWDGQCGNRGGTASCVQNWRARGQAPTIINPNLEERLVDPGRPPRGPQTLEDNPPHFEGDQRVPSTFATSVLLTGEWLPRPQMAAGRELFFRYTVARLQESSFAAALLAEPEAEGPRFCLVFRSADVAARFAVLLQAWADEHGVKTCLRQGLHAGPVALRPNVLSGRAEPVGPHRILAAEICQATDPGRVCASRELVALLAVENSVLHCEYLGLRSPAPDHEPQALYTFRLHDLGAALPKDAGETAG